MGGALSFDSAPSSVAMETTGGGRRKRKTTQDTDTNSDRASTKPSVKRRRK